MEGGRKIVDKQKHELLMRLGQAVSDQVVQGMQSNHLLILNPDRFIPDRKSTRLNSSHIL